MRNTADFLCHDRENPRRRHPSSRKRSLRFEHLEDRRLLSITTPNFPAIDEVMGDVGWQITLALEARNGCLPTEEGYRFDGRNDFLGTGVDHLPAAFSLAQWVKIDALGAEPQTLWDAGGTGATDGWTMEVRPDGTTRFSVQSGEGITSHEPLIPGEWHLIIGTFDPATRALSLSIDGAEAGSSTLTQDLHSSHELHAGAQREGEETGNVLRGMIARPAVYDAVLTAEDWVTIYDAGNEPPAGPSPIDTAEWSAIPDAHKKAIADVSIAPTGDRIATAGADKALRVWDSATGTKVWETTQKKAVKSSIFSPDGKHIATTANDKTIRLWDASTGALEQEVAVPYQPLAAAFSPSGKSLAFVTKKDGVYVFDTGTGSVKTLLMFDKGSNGTAVSFAGEHRVLISIFTGAKKTAKTHVIDATSGAVLHTLQSEMQTVHSAEWSAGASLIALSGTGGTEIYDPATGTLLWRDSSGSGTSSNGAFSPDGDHYFEGDQDGTVRRWDIGGLHSGTLPPAPSTLTKSPGPISSIALSPLGITLVVAENTAAGPGNLSIVKTGVEPPEAPQAESPDAEFEAISTRIASLSGDADALRTEIIALAADVQDVQLPQEAAAVGAQIVKAEELINEWSSERRALIEDVLALTVDMHTIALDPLLHADGLPQSDALGVTQRLLLPSFGGSMAMRSWKGKAAEKSLTIEQGAPEGSGENNFVTRGSMVTLDFADATHPVQEASFTVTSDVPGETLTVEIYRGDAMLGRITPDAQGQVSFEDREGMTGIVVLRGARSGTARIADVRMTGDRLLPALHERGISPESQRIVGVTAAPEWANKAFVPSTVNWNLQQEYPAVRMACWGDTTLYRTVALQQYDAALPMRSDYVMYYDGTTLRPLPKEWYIFDGPGHLILLPGSPQDVFIALEQNNRYANPRMRGGEHLEDVMVPQGFRPGIGEVKLSNAAGNPGLRSEITAEEFTRAERAVNASGRLLINITNRGSGGGSVTVEIFGASGKAWSGAVALSREQTKGIDVNLRADVLHPVRLVLTWGNGERTEEILGVQDGKSADAGSGRVYTAGEQRRIASAAIRAESAAIARGETVSTALVAAADAASNYLSGTGSFDAVAAATGHAGDGTIIVSTEPEDIEAQYALAMYEWVERHPRLVDQVMEKLSDDMRTELITLMSGETEEEVEGASEGMHEEIAAQGLIGTVKVQRLLASAGMSDLIVNHAEAITYAETRGATSGEVDLFTVRGTDTVILASEVSGGEYACIEMLENLTFGSDLTKALEQRGMTGTFDFTDDYINVEQETQLRDLMMLYDAGVHVPGFDAGHNTASSLPGQVEQGLLQGLWATKNGGMWKGLPKDNITSLAADLIGMDVQKLNAVSTKSPDVFANAVGRLLRRSGIDATGDSQSVIVDGLIRQNGTVRAFLGLPTIPGAWRRDVYVSWNGNDEVHLPALSPSQAYIDIPVISFSCQELSVRIVTMGAFGSEEAKSQSVLVRESSTWMDLSTSTEPSRHAKENVALNALKESFPLEGDPASWHQLISSEYHVGDSFNAIDLNRGSGEDDADAGVHAVADGVIESVDPTWGKVRLRHTGQVGNKAFTWYTESLHMPITEIRDERGNTFYEVHDTDGNAVRRFSVGTEVSAGEKIGVVGGRGMKQGSPNDHAFTSHLHLDAEVDGRSVDLRKPLEILGIQTMASDGQSGEFAVQWDPTANTWRNTTYNILLDRSQQESATTIAAPRWVAGSEKLEVRWVIDKNTDSWMWIRIGDDHIYLENGVAKRWTGLGWTDVYLQL